MKIQELRNLIRNEVRKAINESTSKRTLQEAYRDKKDNITILKRCVSLGKRSMKWEDLGDEASSILSNYTDSSSEDYQNDEYLDEAVENLLDEYNPPASIFPYDTTKSRY